MALRGLFFARSSGNDTFPIRRSLAAFMLAGASAAAFPTPVMNMRAEDFVPMASEFRHELKLNANQQTLWLQVEGRSKVLLRERGARRDRLQAALKTGSWAR